MPIKKSKARSGGAEDIQDFIGGAVAESQDLPQPEQRPARSGSAGRPKKYKETPVKRTILVPQDLDAALRLRAEREAAGNVTAIIRRALEEYLI